MRITIRLLPALLFTGGCATPGVQPAPAVHAHWSYEGEEGPSHWASLSPEFAVCGSGREQSPVDLALAPAEPGSAYRPAYAPGHPVLRNNGHTVQVDVPAGSAIDIGGETYALLQYHFHAPSEHTVGGVRLPMELHLVHRGSRGLAVIGVLIREGAQNPAYAPLLDALPARAGEERQIAAEHRTETLLPAHEGPDWRVYRYPGSLTTPPCSEGVDWHVLAEPVELSGAQIEQFRRVFDANSRPVQPLRSRVVHLQREAP
jgi:carbonic anhydrase